VFEESDKRIQSLLMLLINKIDLPYSGVFLTKMLLNNKWDNDIEDIIIKIIRAEDYEHAIDFIINNLKQYYDITFFSFILSLFKQHISREQINSITKLNTAIEKHTDTKKLKQKIEVFENLNPYSMESYQEALNWFTQSSDIRESAEDIKKKFDRIWRKEKANYDKKIVKKNTSTNLLQ
jgi:uncharacterized protein HemY